MNIVSEEKLKAYLNMLESNLDKEHVDKLKDCILKEVRIIENETKFLEQHRCIMIINNKIKTLKDVRLCSDNFFEWNCNNKIKMFEDLKEEIEEE